jgi:hypothetical protein
MRPCEKLVDEHLRHCGYQSVIYEPDGNTTPDFLVDGTVAVEVRRLNPHHFGGDAPEGLEQVANSLWNKVRSLLEEMGPPTAGESWFVHYRFSRPVEDWKTLKTKVRNGLESFMASNPTNHGSIATGNGFEMRVMCRTATPRQSMFVLGGHTDLNSGGMLVGLMRENINHCAIEKDRKVAPVRSKYKEWWLILVDHIGFGLDEDEKDMVKAAMSTLHGWKKIRIIDPGDPSRFFDL